MKILIRTDGGNVPEIGTGHISRTILLAQELNYKFKSLKPVITFISQNLKEYDYGRKKIREAGFNVKKISGLSNNNIIELNEIKKLDANIIIFDPKLTWNYNDQNRISEATNSPYKKRTFTGKIIKTFFKGKEVYNF